MIVVADMGYEIKLIEGAFGEIAGLQILSQSDYLNWKPDLVVAIGVGCIAVGTIVKAMRIMINPDFHYSDFLKKRIRRCKERIESGIDDDTLPRMEEQNCKDAEFDAELAKDLESMEKSLRGEKPILGIFSHESDDMVDYEERYGDYEVNLSLDLDKSDSLDLLAKRIELFLKEIARK